MSSVFLHISLHALVRTLPVSIDCAFFHLAYILTWWDANNCPDAELNIIPSFYSGKALLIMK
jgi:hypothetical protein